LRILLVARQDLTASGTAQTNRLLRALLLAGGDTECRLARGVLTDLTLASAPPPTLQARARTASLRSGTRARI
jgi:hypothetical protein